LSHTRSGIFAPMALAAGMARGLLRPDAGSMLEAALDVIPAQCRLAEYVRRWHFGREGLLAYPWVTAPVNPRHAIASFLSAIGHEAPREAASPQVRLAAAAWRTLAAPAAASPSPVRTTSVAGRIIELAQAISGE
jgi:hypothetical protein